MRGSRLPQVEPVRVLFPMAAPLSIKLGQPSWRLKNSGIETFVTRTAGMLGPATFTLANGRSIQPFAVARRKITDRFAAAFAGLAWRFFLRAVRR